MVAKFVTNSSFRCYTLGPLCGSRQIEPRQIGPLGGKLGSSELDPCRLYWIYMCCIYIVNNWEYMNSWIYMYIGIGYVLVLDIFSSGWWAGLDPKLLPQELWFSVRYILPKIGDIFWYWIYSANNWEIYVNYGVFVRPSGAGLQIVHLLACVSF